VPGADDVLRVVADTHVGAGGASHPTGVPAQAPLAQVSPVVHGSPSSQVAPSAKAYEHTPLSQVPAGA
jgi:hypothetical protein